MGLISREWFSMNPGVMVLICIPLSRRAIQLSPLTLTLAMFSILYHWLKGMGFKKGVCVWHFMPWVSCPGAPSVWSPFPEGLGLPSLAPSPLFGLNEVCSRCHYQQTISDKMIWAATVVTVLLLLSILHCSGKAYNEFLSYALNTIWVFTVNAFPLVSTFFLQVCNPCRRGHSWLTTLKLPQREEACHLGLAHIGPSLAVRWFHCFLLCLLHHLEVTIICLLISMVFR